MEEYHIESNRILLLGYSMGGLGVWYLAARHPDLFCAAIPISALVDAAATPIMDDVPLYLIHGDQDELFPLEEVKRLYQTQKTGGADIELKIVLGASHYQMDQFITPLKATIPWIKNIWVER
jgi:predicted esterase